MLLRNVKNDQSLRLWRTNRAERAAQRNREQMDQPLNRKRVGLIVVKRNSASLDMVPFGNGPL